MIDYATPTFHFRKPYRQVGFAAFWCFLYVISPAEAGPPIGYYDSVDVTNATTLRQTLHEVIDDHTRFPYSSAFRDTWDILEDAQEDPNNPNNILDVYKNASYVKEGGGNDFYNREHTWPNSYGFPTQPRSYNGIRYYKNRAGSAE